MPKPSLLVSSSLLAVFACGIGVGAFGHQYLTERSVSASTRLPSPEEFRKRYLQEMSSRLHLSPAQTDQVRTIMDETRTRFREFREQHKPELDAIQQEQVNRIGKMLNDSQRAEYEKFRAEREAQRKKDEKKK